MSSRLVLVCAAFLVLGGAVVCGLLGLGVAEEYGSLLFGGLWQPVVLVALVVASVTGTLAWGVLRLAPPARPWVQVAAVAAAVTVAGGLGGGAWGEHRHDVRVEAERTACRSGVGPAVQDFAEPSRTDAIGPVSVTGDVRGCVAEVAVPSSEASYADFLGAPAEAQGWRRTTGATWTSPDGSARITAARVPADRSELQPGDPQYLVELVGRPAP